MKKKLLSLALLTILLSLMALGSAAYFTYEGRATNVITTGAVNFELEEKQLINGKEEPYPTEQYITGVMPGRTVSKIPYVVAAPETQPFYTRVRADIQVTLADNTQPPEAEILRYVHLNYDDKNWVEGADGWWYYRGTVSRNEKVALFTEVTFAPEIPNAYQGCRVVVDVYAQATQVKNNPIPQEGYTAIVGWPENKTQ